MDRGSGVVIGAGGHALVCIEVLRAMGLDVAGCVSHDGRASADLATVDVEMIGTVDDLDELLTPETWVFVAVGDNAARRTLVDRVTERGVEVVPAISPDAIVSPSATVAAGALIMTGAVVNAGARIGTGAIVNTAATVDHECSIGAFAHLAPRTALAGAVTVGSGALVGIGATVIPGIVVGEAATVGAGAVVIADVDAGATVVGVPARTLPPPPLVEAPSGPVATEPAPADPVPDTDVVANVLVVCTGNLNRSPLVEALLRRELQALGIDATVSSAGLAAPVGSPVDNKLQRVAHELGVGRDIDAHRARQLSPALLHDADLVLVMTREHLDELNRFGAAAGPAVTLRTAAWRSRVIGRQAIGFNDWVDRLTTELPESNGMNAAADDVADPIGGRLRQYRAMGAEVTELVAAVVNHWGGR